VPGELRDTLTDAILRLVDGADPGGVKR